MLYIRLPVPLPWHNSVCVFVLGKPYIYAETTGKCCTVAMSKIYPAGIHASIQM